MCQVVIKIKPKKTCHYFGPIINFWRHFLWVQSNLSKRNPRLTAIVQFSEVFGFPSVALLVLCA